MIDAWLDDSANGGELASLDYIDPGEIRRQTPNELPELQAMAGEVLGRFAQMCRAMGAG